MTILYYTSFEESEPKVYRELCSRLPIEAKAKLEKFRRKQDAYAFVFGRKLLCEQVLAFGLPLRLEDIKYSKLQRPYFPTENFDFDFNISHSGHCVVCIASNECSVGVDVEEIRNIDVFDFKSQFHSDEWNKISSSDDGLNTFFSYWTRKEAIVKADGRGLTLPFREINLAGVDGQIRLKGVDWFLKEFELSDKCKCAIASGKELHDLVFEKKDWA